MYFSFLYCNVRTGSCSGVDKDIHLAEGGMHCAPALPPLRSSKYDQKLRANSKSELPQRRKDRDTDDSRDDCQLKLNSLSTDLTSCRGIGGRFHHMHRVAHV